MISAGQLRLVAYVLSAPKDALGQRVVWTRTGGEFRCSLDTLASAETTEGGGVSVIRQARASGRWDDVIEAGLNERSRVAIEQVEYRVIGITNVAKRNRRADIDLLEVER